MEQIFSAKIEWYNSVDGEEVKESVFVVATDLRDAIDKIVKQYGEDIEEIISLKPIGQNYVFSLGEDESVAEEIFKVIQDNNMY